VLLVPTRTTYRAQSRFDTPEERVRRNLEFELDLMDATNVVVTTNSELRRDGRPYANQRISDTGVAVYFTQKGHEQAIACDKWDSIRDNLRAVAKAFEALRGIERWGTGEMVDAPSKASRRSRRQRVPVSRSGRSGHGMRC
jgi:hypothetical protein